MSRTQRKSGLNHNYFNGAYSVLDEYYRLVEQRNRLAAYRQKHSNTSKWSQEPALATDEELLTKAKETFHRHHRDGRGGLTCTTINTGFKQGAARITRRANRRFCKMVLDEDPRWEDTAYPDTHDGDHHIWEWW